MADMELISWIDPIGSETILSENDWMHVVGWSGFTMAEFEHQEDIIPFQDGSRYRRSRTLTREVDLNCMVWGSGRAELFQNLRTLKKMFNVYRGFGQIKFTSPDMQTRTLTCLYKEGLEGEEGTNNSGVCWRRVTLVFRAFDPYFYGQETTQSFQLDQNPPKWFPFFPLRLSGEAITSEIEVNNVGDVATYPTWTIYGPGENPVLTNQTTGETIYFLEGLILENEYDSITIDTKNRQITRSDGTNLLGQMAWGSTFWLLQPGVNIIQIEMVGATAASKIDLSYQLRYLGV